MTRWKKKRESEKALDKKHITFSNFIVRQIFMYLDGGWVYTLASWGSSGMGL